MFAKVRNVANVFIDTFPETFKLPLFEEPTILTLPLKLPEFADNTNLPVLLPSSIVLDVATKAVVLATSPVVVKLDALILPVWNAPVVLAINEVPTVSSALLTLVDILANPVTVVLPAANVVIPEAAPAIVKLEPPWIVLVALTNPVTVVLPAASVVIPDTAPENEPVLADNINLPVLLPSSMVLDVATKAVVLATSPVVVKLAALMVPV